MAVLKTNLLEQGAWISEALAVASASTVSPGQLVAFASATEVKPHDVAGGFAEPLFASETQGASLLDNESFAAGDSLTVVRPKSGALINAKLSAANAAITRGDPLVSAGDGSLDKAVAVTVDEGGVNTVTIYDGTIVGFADEDKAPNSGGFIRVRVK